MADTNPELSQEWMKEDFRAWSVKMRAAHAELGGFIVEFSQLEFTIRASLGTALKLPPELLNIVLSLYDYASLCRVWQLVMNHQKPEKKDEIGAIFSGCMKVNDERVRVAHGLWTPGNETLEATIVSRNSLKVDTYFAEPGQLKALSKNCQDLFQRILGMSDALLAMK